MFENLYNDPEVDEELKEQARAVEEQIVQVFMSLIQAGFPEQELSVRMEEDEQGPMLVFLFHGQNIPEGITYEEFVAATETTTNDADSSSSE